MGRAPSKLDAKCASNPEGALDDSGQATARSGSAPSMLPRLRRRRRPLLLRVTSPPSKYEMVKISASGLGWCTLGDRRAYPRQTHYSEKVNRFGGVMSFNQAHQGLDPLILQLMAGDWTMER